MAGWIMTETANGAADIHKNSGVLTYGSTLCPGVPSSCASKLDYTVTAILEEDNTGKFDRFHNPSGLDIGTGKEIEQQYNGIGCNQEMLVMWFNESPNTSYTSILDDNSIFNIKNVDDCEHVIIAKTTGGTFQTGSCQFEDSSYIDSGYPEISWRSSGLTQGHKIKYHVTSGIIPNGFMVVNSSLVELYFPHGFHDPNVYKIGQRAFRGCNRLSAVTFSAIQIIDDYAFSGCSSLSKIDWGHHSNHCDYSSPLHTINEGAFEKCYGLKSLSLPESLHVIGNYAFQNCTGLTSCTIGSYVKTIGISAFQNCTSLTSIDIPNKVTTISGGAFSYCDSLTSCTIGTGVTTIGTLAFNNCTNLEKVTCRATTPPTIDGQGPFYGNSSNLAIYVPSGSVYLYKTASGWSNYSSIIYPIT